MLRGGNVTRHFTFIGVVSWRDGRDATLNFSTGGQLRNFDGGVYWTLVQCIQLRNKGKGIGEIAKWSKYSGVGAPSLPLRESPYDCIDGAASRVLFAARDFYLLIVIDRTKRAGDPSIKLVDHDPVRIRMNI